MALIVANVEAVVVHYLPFSRHLIKIKGRTVRGRLFGSEPSQKRFYIYSQELQAKKALRENQLRIAASGTRQKNPATSAGKVCARAVRMQK